MKTTLDPKKVIESYIKQLIEHIDRELMNYGHGVSCLESTKISKDVELPGLISQRFFDKHIKPSYEEMGWKVTPGAGQDRFKHIRFEFKY